MKGSITSKFLHRIRIRGGEFDASARAMHRKAAFGNVPIATIERKIMSTKTTFKRVALVAVAAVGFGMLTGVAANAVDTAVYVNLTNTTLGGTQATTSNTTAYPALSATQISGVSASVGQAIVLKISTVNDTGTIQSGKALSTVRFQSDALGTLGTSAVLANGTETQTVVTFNAPGLAGTFAGHVIVNNGTTDVSSSVFTVTVSAASPYSASTSTAYLHTAANGVPGTGSTEDAVVVAKAAGTAAGQIAVTLKDATGTAIKGETVNASITGSGLISIDQVASISTLGTARSVTSGVLANNNPAFIHVSSDGSAGVGTITITVTDAVSGATSTLATKTVTFTGSATAYVVTPTYTNLKVGANGTDGNSTTAALAVKVTDANGNIVADGTSVFASSNNTAIATVSPVLTTTAGMVYFAVTGLSADTATITFGNTASSPTVSATAVVKFTAAVASMVTLAFDKATYAPGEKMILTLTALNAAGAGLPDGTYTLFSTASLTSNVALQGFPVLSPVTDVALVAGVKSWTVFAPLAGGTINVAATTGIGTSLATAAQGLSLTATAEVTGDTSAVDAANAATDAANYAADAADAATTAAEEATAAAQAAQDSADAASAAVVALGLRVAVLYAATRTQVLRLQALLVRLIKKLHA
jgi:hypothetical protein